MNTFKLLQWILSPLATILFALSVHLASVAKAFITQPVVYWGRNSSTASRTPSWCPIMLGFDLLHDQLALCPLPCKSLLSINSSYITDFLQAVDSFLALPCGPCDELVKCKLTLTQWEVLLDFEIILEVISYIQSLLLTTNLNIIDTPCCAAIHVKWEDAHPRWGDPSFWTFYDAVGTTGRQHMPLCSIYQAWTQVGSEILPAHGADSHLHNCYV